MKKFLALPLASFFLCSCSGQADRANETECLLKIHDTVSEQYGYINHRGDTVIPLGKYAICFTDTFAKMAVVLDRQGKFMGIDRDDKAVFQIFAYDNGPDYRSQGLFRIVGDNGKIGFADLDGMVVIQPQFDMAFPFENDTAIVLMGGQKTTDGEHTAWQGGERAAINRKGEIIARYNN